MVVSSRKVGGSHDVCRKWNGSSISLLNCPRCTGIGAHDGPESLPTMRRNWCPRCAGIRTSSFNQSQIDDDATRQIAFVFLGTADENFAMIRLDIKVRLAVRICEFSVGHACWHTQSYLFVFDGFARASVNDLDGNHK